MSQLRGRFAPPLIALALLANGCAHREELPLASSADPDNENRTAAMVAEELDEISRAKAHDESDVNERRPPQRQSISLGETWVPPRWASPHPVAYGAMPPVVVINNYNQTPAVAPNPSQVTSPYYYPMVGHVGYAASSTFSNVPARQSTASVPSSGVPTPQVGGDWPSVPSYGPRMMTHTAPSSTWPR